MIDAATDSIPEVASAIADIDGVSEDYSTAGEVDLIAIVRVREFEQIAEVIAGQVNKVPGVLETEDRKSTRLNSSHANISYAVFCLKNTTAVVKHHKTP